MHDTIWTEMRYDKFSQVNRYLLFLPLQILASVSWSWDVSFHLNRRPTRFNQSCRLLVWINPNLGSIRLILSRWRSYTTASFYFTSLGERYQSSYISQIVRVLKLLSHSPSIIFNDMIHVWNIALRWYLLHHHDLGVVLIALMLFRNLHTSYWSWLAESS